jgi:thiosulfate/3-mercaptopyruvate sulfurtransferase
MSLVDGRHLIDVQQLAALQEDPALRIFDCTVHLRPDPPRTYRIESGREDWLDRHIPGAGFLDLPGALSDDRARVPFTMPTPETLADALGRAGVVDGARIVLYSTSHPMWATRLWWMLRSIGVDAGVLDGGLAAWIAAGHPTESGPCTLAPGTLSCRWRPALWADQEQVLAHVGDDAICTINALAPAVYRGDGGTNYGRPGHITGSVNVPYAILFDDAQHRFAQSGVIRSAFDAVGAFDRPVICYCGGGISATCDAFALTVLGHERVSVYDGSMNEWVRDPALPMTLGAEPG